MSDDYCGWPNRETWLVALHLQNDEQLALVTSDLGQQALFAYPDDADLATVRYANLLNETFGCLFDQHPVLDLPMLYRELLGTAWAKIDWMALANIWLEDFLTEVRLSGG